MSFDATVERSQHHTRLQTHHATQKGGLPKEFPSTGRSKQMGSDGLLGGK